MDRLGNLELFRKYLFETPEKPIPKSHQERLIRLRQTFSHWVEFPMKSEVEIKDYLMTEFSLGRSTAYQDITMLKRLMGNVQNAGKEWHRYRVISMIEESYALAKKRKDAKAMSMLIDKYGKYTQLHIPDREQIPWEQIIPQLIEPTEDPTVIGLERDPDVRLKARRLIEKYSNEITANVKAVHIEDAEFIEMEANAKDH